MAKDNNLPLQCWSRTVSKHHQAKQANNQPPPFATKILTYKLTGVDLLSEKIYYICKMKRQWWKSWIQD